MVGPTTPPTTGVGRLAQSRLRDDGGTSPRCAIDADPFVLFALRGCPRFAECTGPGPVAPSMRPPADRSPCPVDRVPPRGPVPAASHQGPTTGNELRAIAGTDCSLRRHRRGWDSRIPTRRKRCAVPRYGTASPPAPNCGVAYAESSFKDDAGPTFCRARYAGTASSTPPSAYRNRLRHRTHPAPMMSERTCRQPHRDSAECRILH